MVVTRTLCTQASEPWLPRPVSTTFWLHSEPSAGSLFPTQQEGRPEAMNWPWLPFLKAAVSNHYSYSTLHFVFTFLIARNIYNHLIIASSCHECLLFSWDLEKYHTHIHLAANIPMHTYVSMVFYFHEFTFLKPLTSHDTITMWQSPWAFLSLFIKW